jgi:citrate synthase
MSSQLGLLRSLPKYFTEDMILKSPSSNIMNKMARCTLGLNSYDDNPDDTSLENLMRQGMELIARFPIMLAYAYQAKRHFYDHKSLHIHFPHGNQSTAESILRAVRSNKKFTKEEAKLLDLCLVVHAEHGGGNNSTFACRVASSSGTDTYAAIASALASLKGPLHGGANISAMHMIDDIRANVPNWQDDGAIRDYLAKLLRKEAGDRSGLIYGMGHAVYTISDPRVKILKENARRLADEKGTGDELRLIESVERLAPEVFADVKGSDKPLCANLDLYSGFVYRTLDIPEELFTPIFAAARISGWIAHRIEEVYTSSRIIRPAYRVVYDKRDYVAMSLRDKATNE